MITIYLYSNVVEPLIWDPTIFTTRNREMYARPVTVYQGIDNPIQVKVKNQDQKSVDMEGYALQADIQDPLNYLTVFSLGIQFFDASKGLGTFVISKSVVNQLDQRKYKLTFRTIKISDNTERPAYIDDNYKVPLELNVLPGYYSDSPPDEEETDDFETIDGGNIQ